MHPVDLLRSTVRVFADPAPGPRRIGALAAALVVAATLVALLRQGASHIMAPWDVFILLDGGWRIVSGQIPHTDFHNPIGPVTYLLVACGMELGSPSLGAVALGNALFTALVVAWAWGVGRSRLSGPLLFLWLIFSAFLCLATRPLGYAVETKTYAMLYNRYGYVLLSILVLQVFLLPHGERPARAWGRGLSVGLLLGLLLYVKVTYFAFGALTVAAALVLRAVAPREIATQVVGLAAVVLAFFLLIGIDPLAYAGDVLAAGRSQSAGLRRQWLVWGLQANLSRLYLLGLLSLAVATTPPAVPPRPGAIGRGRTLAMVGWIVLCALALTTGNASEGSDIPLFFVAGLVLLHHIGRVRGRAEEGSLNRGEVNYLLALAVVLPVLLAPLLYKDARSVAGSVLWHRRHAADFPPTQRFDAPPLADFRVPGDADWRTAYWRAHQVPGRIDEALSLLRGHVGPDSRIFAMALANPFPFALQLPPPSGLPLWWDLHFNFSVDDHPDAERVLGGVDLVLVPLFDPEDEGCCQETVLTMLEIYGRTLATRFQEVERTPHWRLLRARER